MNYTKMSGYEFEDYIATLFRKLGFKVSQTAYSNDGGMDLLAVMDKPIYKGKYIIQCKNWTNDVGQPEVRDLYGVVMSENANKGILISTGGFSEQAYDFAKNKNLELMDGHILASIIEQAGMEDYQGNNDKPAIDMVQYNYWNQRISDDIKDEAAYNSMLSFLHGYIEKNDTGACTRNFFETYLRLLDDLKKHCFRSKSKVKQASLCELRKSEIYMIEGDIDKALEILIKENHFDFKAGWKYLGLRDKVFIRFNFLLADLYQIAKSTRLRELESLLQGKIQLSAKEFKERDIIGKLTSVDENQINKVYENYFYFFQNKEDIFIYPCYERDFNKWSTWLLNDNKANGSIQFYIKNYYRKSAAEINDAVNLVLKQHAILVEH